MKRAVIIFITHRRVPGPGGQVALVKKENTRVIELTTTLKELHDYLERREVEQFSVVFETEDPDSPSEPENPSRPKLVK